jgi:methylmalonyl-CoA mutase C-terminal domain/subunit
MAENTIRILVAKPGLDCHDRGARVIARYCREAGFDVIYTGCHQTPVEIAAAAVREKVNIVGLSCLSGEHRSLFPQVVASLREMGGGDIKVICGGIIPEQDFQMLHNAGIKAIFTPGATLESIVNWIRNNV